MGTTSSFEENLQTKTSRLTSTKNQIDLTFEKINEEANRIIDFVKEMEYDDKEKVCNKLAPLKLHELMNVKTSVLEGIYYHMGINEEVHDKEDLCIQIANFYMKKINLISTIQKELPYCRDKENKIYNDLMERIKSDDYRDPDEWLAIYNKMHDFNQEIKNRYILIEKEIKRIKEATTMREIDNIIDTTNIILSGTNKICDKYEQDLNLYKRKIYSPVIRRSIVTQEPPVEITQGPLTQEPQIKNIYKDVPIIERTILTPRVVRRETHQLPYESKVLKITGESVRRNPDKIVIRNPQKIESIPVTRSFITTPVTTSIVTTPVTRSVITTPTTKTFIPTSKTTRTFVRPTVSQTTIVSSLAPGTKVRAIADHVPLTSSELSLYEGQITSYVKPAPRNWALVRHDDGKVGHVPESHLSLF